MTEAPERQPAAWRYSYQEGRWTVQKHKPAWWTPDSVFELEPLFPAPDADKVQALVEAARNSVHTSPPHPAQARLAAALAAFTEAQEPK